MNRSILLGSILMLACGSRSGLFDPRTEDAGVEAGLGGNGDGGFGAFGGRGGFGGVSGSGAYGGSGATGGVAGVGVCNGLIQIQPIVSVEHAASESDSQPALIPTMDDGHQVTVAFVREPVEGFSVLRHATFAPWLSWPANANLAPTYSTFASTVLSDEFQVARSGFNQFALLVAHPNIVSFAPRVQASLSDPGPNVTLTGAAPVFAASQSQALHLLGTLSEENELYAQVVNSAGNTFSTSIATIGCASGQIFGGAVPLLLPTRTASTSCGAKRAAESSRPFVGRVTT